MADPMSVTGSTGGIDISRWKKLTAQEIIREQSKGEDIPTEILNWAEEMASLSQVPDDVTYEEVDGDVGIDALAKLGLDNEEMLATTPEGENAQAPLETEEPDAVQDPARPTELGEDTTLDENIFSGQTQGFISDTNRGEERTEEDEQLTLADPALTTDPEEIRKRKRRLGLE